MSTLTDDALVEALRPLTADPGSAAVLCDVDGVLAPIVYRAADARVSEDTARVLGRLARRYACVACVSGRSAADARRLVGVGSIAYAGSHGAEMLDPGTAESRVMPAFRNWEERVRSFVGERDMKDLRRLGIRIEDKGAIAALHWRGAPDEEAAHALLKEVAAQAGSEGLSTHWARKVLEIRPPLAIHKGLAVRELVESSGARVALFAGDDTTDLDAFSALELLVEEGALDQAVRVGVSSDEGPAAIVERADLVVDGVEGFARVLAALAGA